MDIKIGIIAVLCVLLVSVLVSCAQDAYITSRFFFFLDRQEKIINVLNTKNIRKLLNDENITEKESKTIQKIWLQEIKIFRKGVKK